MAVKASFSAIAVVFAVVLFMMSSIVSGQDIESSPSPAPERGFAVANSVGASASLMLIFSLVASIIN